MNRVFELTNKYMILATPLILFSLISNIYIAISAHGRVLNLIFALFLLLLMISAFIAGWFTMIKKAILEPDRDDPNSLMGEFTAGVGEYFLSTNAVVLNLFFITLMFFSLAFFIGTKLIGDIGVSPEAFSNAMASTDALKSFMLSLSKEQLIKMNQWNFLLLFSLVCSNFLTIFYIPATFFKDKNPFKALFISIKDLFCKKFFTTLGIAFLIFVCYSIISILMALFAGNIILHFVMTLINFYFIMVVCVGIFYYYYNSFINPHLGQNVDIKI